MSLHPRDWIDHVPGWLIAALALSGFLTAVVSDHVFLTLGLLGIAGGLAFYRYQPILRDSDLWALEEWFTARRAAFSIREWRSPYQAAALYCAPSIVQARDEAAREMNATMMELVRAQKAPAFASLGSGSSGAAEPSRLTQQARYEAAQIRHDQCNAALGRELAAQLASGALMAKGLLLSGSGVKSERIIATARWRLLELNIAKSEASGPAGEYAGVVIGKPIVKPQAMRKPALKPPRPPAAPAQLSIPASNAGDGKEKPTPGSR